MNKNPIIVNEDMLAAEVALSIMNSRKNNSVCVFKKINLKTIGLIHMHNILKINIIANENKNTFSSYNIINNHRNFIFFYYQYLDGLKKISIK